MDMNFTDYNRSYDEFVEKSVNALMICLQPVLKQVEIIKETSRGVKIYSINNEYKEANMSKLEAEHTMQMSTLYNTDTIQRAKNKIREGEFLCHQ